MSMVIEERAPTGDETRTVAPRTWPARPPSARRAVARMVQAVGLVNAALSVLPAGQQRFPLLADVVPTACMVTARAATGVVGVLLIYLGAGLRRGSFRAWQLALALSALRPALHLAKGYAAPAAVAAGIGGLLLASRHQFTTAGDPRNRWRAVRAAALFLAAGFALGFAEIAVRANKLIGDPSMWQWTEHATLGLIGVSGPVRFLHPIGGATVTVTTGAFGMLAFASLILFLVQPSADPARTEPADESRLRDLLDRYGDGDSLGYFALRHDKQIVWAPSGKAAIAYRVINGVSLASGDPVGLPSEWPQAIGQWLADCGRHGWTPAVLACGTTGGKAYRRAGLDIIELGDEAILDATTFSLSGRAMRGVRQAVNRMRRAGYTCQVVRQRDLPPPTLAEVARCAAAFRDGKVERGFSMALSRLGDPADADCVLVLCRDGAGSLRGLLHFVPWGGHGLSLDLMRGDRTAPNGLTELMVVSAVEAAATTGIASISLNFAVLRSVFARAEGLGAGPIIRIWYRLLRLASRVWQIESLYRANAKYEPQWRPRFLCFPAARDLPRISVAALGAEAFLPGFNLTGKRDTR